MTVAVVPAATFGYEAADRLGYVAYFPAGSYCTSGPAVGVTAAWLLSEGGHLHLPSMPSAAGCASAVTARGASEAATDARAFVSTRSGSPLETRRYGRLC